MANDLLQEVRIKYSTNIIAGNTVCNSNVTITAQKKIFSGVSPNFNDKRPNQFENLMHAFKNAPEVYLSNLTIKN